MRSLFFQPHSDDLALFSAFNLLKEKSPTVLTVFRSHKQLEYGITALQREREDRCAFNILGNPSSIQWTYQDINPDFEMIEIALKARFDSIYDHFYAPYPEPNGNREHNFIGEVCQKYLEPERLTLYMTYQWPEGKSRSKNRVEHTEEMMQKKLKALACYQSQINLPATSAHFLSDFEEYVL